MTESETHARGLYAAGVTLVVLAGAAAAVAARRAIDADEWVRHTFEVRETAAPQPAAIATSFYNMPRGYCGEGNRDPIEDRTVVVGEYWRQFCTGWRACEPLAQAFYVLPFNRGTVGSTKAFVCRLWTQEIIMGFGRGLLLWLIGIPLPIILLIALFMHH